MLKIMWFLVLDFFLVFRDSFKQYTSIFGRETSEWKHKITFPIKANNEVVANRVDKGMREVSGTFGKQADGKSSLISMRDYSDICLFTFSIEKWVMFSNLDILAGIYTCLCLDFQTYYLLDTMLGAGDITNNILFSVNFQFNRECKRTENTK